ncbi:hypothetical protein ANCCAN_21185, partial [Ancylostoma caninum]
LLSDQKGESVEKTKIDKQPIFQDRIKPTDAQKTVFDAFVKGVFENGVEGLIKEYAVLKPYLAASYSREIFDQNSIKNRYKGGVCSLRWAAGATRLFNNSKRHHHSYANMFKP